MKRLFTLLFICCVHFGQSQISLVKEISAGADHSATPDFKCVYNGFIYFSAADGQFGQNAELWRSDGTEPGTTLVKDINVGINGSQPQRLIVFNNKLIFSAITAANGRELWISDGTLAGTVLLKDIIAGTNSSTPTDFTIFNNELYFTVSDALSIRKAALWKTDGTTSGTVLVKEFNTVTQVAIAERLIASGNKLFFWATTDAAGAEPWVSDGTAVGTVMIKDIMPGSESSHGPVVDFSFVGDGAGTVYFKAAASGYDRELWKSDGTLAGTVLVKDIYPGSFSSELTYMTRVNGTLYFTADDGVSGMELWKSDGTSAGTITVKNINPSLYVGSGAQVIGVLGNTLFLRARSGTTGYELWKTDGTDAGTVQVKELYPGISNGVDNTLAIASTVANGSLYFQGTTSAAGRELWKSDGTEAGTTMVQDLQAGAGNTNPVNFIMLGNTLMFSDDPATTKVELYKLDATPLPLKLISFGAGAANAGVFAKWITNSEVNVSRFSLEHSTNGNIFSSIASISAKNSLLKNEYQFLHAAPANGTNFYRLKMIDKDGTYSYSNIANVHWAHEIALALYPNPGRHGFILNGLEGSAKVVVISSDGKQVATFSTTNGKWNEMKLVAGIYRVQVVDKNDMSVISYIQQ